VDRLLLISGTASIVGHESLHMGDVGAQTREIVTNLRAVLAAGEGLGGEVDATTLQLKVYARDPSATPTIRTVLSDMLPTKSRLFLHADICRPELLVEIEGVCSFLPPSAVPVR
jgi:enamine deaminase RidA (YjgF/YER057c/UK114 family)